jgi:hypothetical protein
MAREGLKSNFSGVAGIVVEQWSPIANALMRERHSVVGGEGEAVLHYPPGCGSTGSNQSTDRPPSTAWILM